MECWNCALLVRKVDCVKAYSPLASFESVHPSASYTKSQAVVISLSPRMASTLSQVSDQTG